MVSMSNHEIILRQAQDERKTFQMSNYETASKHFREKITLAHLFPFTGCLWGFVKNGFAASISRLMALCFGSMLFFSAGSSTYAAQESNRVTVNLDTGWLFNNTDNTSFSGGAGYNDANWTKVCLPHSNKIIKHAYFNGGTVYTAAGAEWAFTSWYRRHYNPPSSYSGRRFFLEFQGVATVASVYVNGAQVDANGAQSGLAHQGAYTPFTIDITSQIVTGQDNVIAVQVNANRQTSVPPEGGNIDFYVFGGIVRHVNLIVTNPLYIDWTFVSTQNPSQTLPSNPTVSVKTRVVNNNGSSKTCMVISNIVDLNNNVVASASSQATIPANGSVTVSQTTSAISNPNLWSVDYPNLYNVYIQVQDGISYADEYWTRLGIRSLTMNKIDGKCYLNGQPLKLRGTNRHETYPYIGRAASKRLQRKDADILKYDLGCNIVRTSHYPQAPAFLDRCDEIGLLVLEEIPGWQHLGSGTWRELEMQNLIDMVIRDRNHPCIFTWGCRVNESPDDTWYKSTNDTARALDPTRLTCGVRYSAGSDPAYFYEDIWTQNFVDAVANPTQVPWITTEEIGHNYPVFSFSREDSLIVVVKEHANTQNKSYASSKWGGTLGWCAFDYNSPHDNAVSKTGGRYVSDHGHADIFRILKFPGYFFQSQRDPVLYGPMVYILNLWTDKSPVDSIFVVSNCEQVELFVNGVSKGKITPGYYKSLPHPLFAWSGIPYASGNLRVDGYLGGSKVTSQTWYTPGKPSKLVMIPDTTTIYEGGDMARIIVIAQDANNQYVPRDSTLVSLSVSGAGDFIGETPIKLEDAKTCFYIKTRASATGTITCNASATGLTPASITITVIKDPGDGTAIQSNRIVNRGIPAEKAWCRIVAGERFNVPTRAGKDTFISIYDISGKLLYRKAAFARSIDFPKLGMAENVHIVKITYKSKMNIMQ